MHDLPQEVSYVFCNDYKLLRIKTLPGFVWVISPSCIPLLA